MPTTFQIREILARHANIINIFITSFCQEKYRVGISLLYSVLILLNSENPLRFLRIAVDMRILFSCSYYLLILRPAFSWYQPPVNCVLWQYSQLGQSSFHHAHATYLTTYQSVRELDNFIFYLNYTSSQNLDAWICGFDPSFLPLLASVYLASPAAVLRCWARPPNHQLPSSPFSNTGVLGFVRLPGLSIRVSSSRQGPVRNRVSIM